MSNLIILAILIAAAVLCAWAGVRAWSNKRRAIRWGGATTASLLIVILCLIGGAAANGLRKMHLRDAPVSELKVDADSAQIRRGQAISDSFCGACHSRTGTLTGGVDLGKDLSHRLGSFVSSNLTPAGPLQHWTDGQIFRAIRNGIGADGRWLVVMSLTNTGKLSDDDTCALIAYMRQLPADGEPTPDPPDSFNFLGLLLLGASQFPLGKPVFNGVITAPPPGPTVAYGEYILSYNDCRGCHGTNLHGGVAGQLGPIGPDLDVVKDWTRDGFIATMRTGRDPYGHDLGPQMPWRPIGKMNDDELSAVYAYLSNMPKVSTKAAATN
jgi:mono/diheme cytochrome c family protein